MKTAILLIALMVPAFSAQVEPVSLGATQYNGQMFTSQKVAREIMGKNYFGVEDAIKHFKINLSKEEIAGLSEVPFSEVTLKKCAKTHILVAVFPLSILEIREGVERGLFKYHDHENAWYNNQAFAGDRGEASWYLVRKTEVPNSTNKNWSEQLALLGENEDAPSFSVDSSDSTLKNAGEQQSTIGRNEEVPSARVMVYTIIGYYLNNDERLFRRMFVHVTDVGPGGNHLLISFDYDGLNISGIWDDYRFRWIGLAGVHRKFQ